jgi:hypothetical protein
MKHAEEDNHAIGLVGRNALRKALDDKQIRLSQYTLLEESEHRYFKNRLGGLGQYYLGTLRDLGVLSGDTRSGVQYTKERGVVLAEAFDRGVNRARFFEVLKNGNVTPKTLEELEGFCTCHLKTNATEQRALLSLFSNQQRSEFFDEAAIARRCSLGIFLDFISKT